MSIKTFGSASGFANQVTGLNMGLFSPNIKSVQQFNLTKTAATDNITISAVDVNKAIVIVSFQQGTGAAQANAIKVKITSPTNVEVSTATNSAGKVCIVTIVEFNNVKTLQKGDILASTGTTVTISNVNTAKTMLFFSYSDTNNLSVSSGVLAYISAANQITINGTGTSTVHWQAIEFN